MQLTSRHVQTIMRTECPRICHKISKTQRVGVTDSCDTETTFQPLSSCQSSWLTWTTAAQWSRRRAGLQQRPAGVPGLSDPSQQEAREAAAFRLSGGREQPREVQGHKSQLGATLPGPREERPRGLCLSALLGGGGTLDLSRRNASLPSQTLLETSTCWAARGLGERLGAVPPRGPSTDRDVSRSTQGLMLWVRAQLG